VWGRRAACKAPDLQSRFTPTRVGKTRKRSPAPRRTPVHPHACGEDTKRSSTSSSCCGSPPRVWGRHLSKRLCSRPYRFTPTRVGKTPPSPPPSALPSVHPHACGEDILTAAEAQPASGSPPRVWGRQDRPARVHAVVRFTPTRVGKTSECEAACV